MTGAISAATKNQRTRRVSNKIVSRRILDHVFSHSNELPLERPLSFHEQLSLRKYHFDKVLAQVERNEQITIVLPAFPAKSPNREKTLGDDPDMGEVLALRFLNRLCRGIRQFYAPGAKIVICSDGRVFSDLVMVDDRTVDRYAQKIRRLIHELDLECLDTFHLEDVFPEMNYREMRDHLADNYAAPVDEIRRQVKEGEMREMFNGIHRFIVEDRLALERHLYSKNNIRKRSKKIAYQVIQRSNAWSRLVEEAFPHAVRLSIHPQLPGSKKIGIRMIACANIWGTPWHNVALYDGHRWQLVKRKEAEAQQARLAYFMGKYPYYTVQ